MQQPEKENVSLPRDVILKSERFRNHCSKSDIKEEARGRWTEILFSLGVAADNLVLKKHCACPHCGGKDRYKFDDIDGNGSYFCSGCGSGDGFSLLMKVRGWSFPQALEMVSNYLNMGQRPLIGMSTPILAERSSVSAPDEKAQAYIKRVWRESVTVQESDPVGKYLLETRQLPVSPIPPALRYHPNLKTVHEDVFYDRPAMIGAVHAPDGELRSLHRTFLTSEGRKAFGAQSKKLARSPWTGSLSGCAIRLFDAGEELLLAEGIETALAGFLLTDIPSWACITAGLMLKVIIPDQVRTITICIDGDETGQRTAMQLAERLNSEGRSISLIDAADLGLGEHADLADFLTKS